MHDCLLVPELVRHIAEACSPDYKKGQGEVDNASTLSALARTCHALHEPTLDVLWYSQFGLRRLVRLMPRELWEVREGSVTMDDSDWIDERLQYKRLCLTHARDIVPADWERFDFYAQRVRKLDCHRFYRGDVDPTYAEPTPEVYSELAAARKTPLLPQLQHLYDWGALIPVPNAAVNDMQYFLAPSLQTIYLAGSLDTSAEIVESLPGSCPSLQRFHLHTVSLDRDLPHLQRALEHWPGLGRLSIHFISPRSIMPAGLFAQCLDKLAALPKLYELEVRLYLDHQYTGQASAHNLYTFKTLESLRLSLNTDAAAFIAKCWFPALKNLDLGLDLNTLFPTLSTLPEHISKDVLEDLVMITNEHFADPAASIGPVVRYAQLEPLTAFHSLRALTVSTEQTKSIQMCDDEWGALARAWPHLQKVHIHGTGDVEASSDRTVAHATYKAIAHLVRFCPELIDIGLTIADPPITDLEQAMWEGLEDLPVSPRSVKLNLYDSSLDEVFTARWVARMFPNIAVVWRTVFGDMGPGPGVPPEFQWPTQVRWDSIIPMAQTSGEA